uniref:Ovule protein n=1 Tax=Strongyloides papillosus TaxID=174720 RepID=A0A0N5CHA4_STREA
MKFYAVCSRCSKSTTSLSSFDNEEFFCNTPGGDNPGVSSKTNLVEEDSSTDLVSLASDEEQKAFNAFYHSDSSFMV